MEPRKEKAEWDQVKERAKAAWAFGDYARVAEMLQPAADRLVEACSISDGTQVLGGICETRSRRSEGRSDRHARVGTPRTDNSYPNAMVTRQPDESALDASGTLGCRAEREVRRGGTDGDDQ